jgi:hypothetical protein
VKPFFAEKAGLFLALEASEIKELAETSAASSLRENRGEFLLYLRDTGQSRDLSAIVAIEKVIVRGDLDRYANNKNMTFSLKNALPELEAIQNLLKIVDDKRLYAHVDKAYSLPRNQEKDLPKDEAYMAFKSHYARLNNLDKSRLNDKEKEIIDARKGNIAISFSH